MPVVVMQPGVELTAAFGFGSIPVGVESLANPTRTAVAVIAVSPS